MTWTWTLMTVNLVVSNTSTGRIQIDMRAECLAKADDFMSVSWKKLKYIIFVVSGIYNIY